jgi:hypothetical protein
MIGDLFAPMLQARWKKFILLHLGDTFFQSDPL